jgi:hypothetical protein
MGNEHRATLINSLPNSVINFRRACPRPLKHSLATGSQQAEARIASDEETAVPVDVSAGRHQAYDEDCLVCRHPMTLHVNIDTGNEAHVHGERK